MFSKRQRKDAWKQSKNSSKHRSKGKRRTLASISCDTPHELTPGNNSSLSLVPPCSSPHMGNKAKGLPQLWLYLQDGHYHRRWRPYLACSPPGNTGCKKASDKRYDGSLNCLCSLWGQTCCFWDQNTPTLVLYCTVDQLSKRMDVQFSYNCSAACSHRHKNTSWSLERFYCEI